MKSQPIVRDAQLTDAPRIAEIYNYYIQNTIITFESEDVSTNEMITRITICQEKFPWLVIEVDGTVKGYAYANAWKNRTAYQHSAEVTIYLDHQATGKGYGKLLYGALIDRLKKSGLHALLGGIALPNDASVALHETMGFEKVAHFRETGFKFGKWIDVGYWELILIQAVV